MKLTIPFVKSAQDARDLVQTARNESLSYFNFNGQRIDQLKYMMWEGNQKLLDRFYATPTRKGTMPVVKVVFLVPDTALWDVYAPIHARMQQDPRFVTAVVAFRRADIGSDKSTDEVAAFFDERGIDCRLEGFNADRPCTPIRAEDADVLFYTLGSAAYPHEYKIEYTSLYCRTCYLPYGVLLSNQESYQFDQDFHHAAWAVFAATEREAELYRRHGKRIASNVVLSGYPKYDVLMNHGGVTKPDRPLIVWAPHWTLGLVYPALNFGLFDRVCMDMYELIKDHPEYDFVYKPHPNLPYALKQTTFMDDAAYALYLSMLERLPNCRIWKHGDYADLFIASSMMITDSISFLAEYLVTGNPLLFLERPDRARLNELGEQLIDLHYRGSTIADIRAFIQQQLHGEGDRRREERMQRGSHLLEVRATTASEVIVSYLASRFGLDNGMPG
jgi:hypothetical protein